jgi:hypothetical protein
MRRESWLTLGPSGSGRRLAFERTHRVRIRDVAKDQNRTHHLSAAGLPNSTSNPIVKKPPISPRILGDGQIPGLSASRPREHPESAGVGLNEEDCRFSGGRPPACPLLAEWLLPVGAVQELFDKLDAPEIHQPGVLLEPSIERHGDLPGSGEDLLVLDRGLVQQHV